jgi:TPR repeat protein
LQGDARRLSVALFQADEELARFELPEERPLILGKAEDCDVLIPEQSISSHHARMWNADGGLQVQDLGSTNGTLVNGKLISEPCRLVAGDVIGLGSWSAKVLFPSSTTEPSLAPEQSPKFASRARRRKRIAALLGILLTAGLVATVGYAAWARRGLAEYKVGLQLHETHDYKGAAESFYRGAQLGHLGAQFEIGRRYLEGSGVSPDTAEAIHWLDMAAKRGSLEAQKLLAGLYSVGEDGFAKNPSEAFRLFRLAAEQGDAHAQMSVGVALLYGEGAPKDMTQAVRWLRKAARQDNALAQHVLGLCYEFGDGVRRDSAAAFRWNRRAANLGNEDAVLSVAEGYATGTGVRRDATKAVALLRDAIRAGDVRANRYLAGMYSIGEGVPKDSTEAMRLLHVAADGGDVYALSSLGDVYLSGSITAKNEGEAVRWYRKAAEQGHAPAQFCLGRMCANGEGVAKDAAEAVRWYRLAAEQGHLDAY